MPPITYTISITGNGDDGDEAKPKVVEAFDDLVLALRDAGVTVSGTLTGNVAARRNEADTDIIPVDVIHVLAGDVEQPKKGAKHS